MRRVWVAATAVVALAGFGWWCWPYLQLTRADAALSRLAAPHLLYWPGQAADAVVFTPVDRMSGEGPSTLARIAGGIEAVEARWGPTARTTYLRGRLASLRGATAEAVRLMHLASLLDPDDAALQTAYGVSLAIRATAENRVIDWATAIDVLLQASELPDFPALGYADLAQASEQLPAPHAAAGYWKQALTQAGGPWKPVFSQNLSRLEAEKASRLQRIALVSSQRQPSRDIPGSAEYLLQLALAEWLPKRADFSGDLTRVAEHFRLQLTDPALRDLLAATPKAVADEALGRATLANANGDYRSAAEAGLQAGQLYAEANNAAGRVLAGVQTISGLRRSGRAAECRALGEESRLLARARGYRWAELRAEQEAMSCKSQERAIDVLAEREAVATRVAGSGFLDLELRAEGSLIEPSRGFTAPVESWDRARRGLASYGRSVLPAPFAVNFLSPLGMMAESFGYSRLASLLFREAMAVMEDYPNQWLRDAIRFDFFRLNPSAKLPGATTIEIELAARELAEGRGSQALARLRRVTSGTEFPYLRLERYERIRLLPVLGRAFWQQGQRDEAMRHFRVLIDETVSTVRALQGRRQRYATALEVGPAWRLLTEAQLEAEGATAALRTWQTFRTLPNPGQSVSLSPPAGEVRLALALLPSGPVVWWADGRGIAVHRVAQKRLTLRAQRFAALVANPSSPLAMVNESAREIYELLIAPFEGRLEGAKTLAVDPDGPLAVLPWGALRDRQGRSLLSRVAIVQTIGWGTPPGGSPQALIPAARDWQPALVVAEPTVDPHDRGRFPALAEARGEAEHLRTIFPRNLYLSGQEARVEALQRELGHHHLFHFAGHGVANGGNGALVLAGEPPVGTRLITASEIADLDLHALRLATLASCSSGSGEDRGTINVESLVQAFLDAGTAQVLASRWNVDSRATSRVMQPFYEGLRQGVAPAAALRAAALAVERLPLQRHPYYWAAFQMFGLP